MTVLVQDSRYTDFSTEVLKAAYEKKPFCGIVSPDKIVGKIMIFTLGEQEEKIKYLFFSAKIIEHEDKLYVLTLKKTLGTPDAKAFVITHFDYHVSKIPPGVDAVISKDKFWDVNHPEYIQSLLPELQNQCNV